MEMGSDPEEGTMGDHNSESQNKNRIEDQKPMTGNGQTLPHVEISKTLHYGENGQGANLVVNGQGLHLAENGQSPHHTDIGNGKLLQRKETVPDIKRDTSGITTQYIAAGVVNLGSFAAGLCVAWSSSALPLLVTPLSEAPETDYLKVEPSYNNLTHDQHRVELTPNEASWVASVLCLGAIWGAVPAGLISEYFGRKKTLLYLALPLVVSWILVASSPNVYGLYVGRFVSGVAMGAFSVAIPPYVADIAEAHVLPSLVTFYHLLFACGVLLGYILGLVQNVVWLSVLCAVIPVVFFVAFIFLPESPTYLMSQGKLHEAKAALRYFRGIDNNIDAEIKELKEHIRNYAKNKVSFKELFDTRSTLKALIVSLGLLIFQQSSGIYPILFNAENIFKTFNVSMHPPSATIVLGFILVTSTYFSSTLINRIKRRTMLMTSFFLMSVSSLSLAIYYNVKSAMLSSNPTWMPLISLCIYVCMYASGVGPIPWLMLREVFPPNVTRRAIAIMAGFHWFLSFLVTKLYQNSLDLVKPGWTLLFYASNCFVGVIFVYFLVPETKDRSLEEIQSYFEGKVKKKTHIHVIEVVS